MSSVRFLLYLPSDGKRPARVRSISYDRPVGEENPPPTSFLRLPNQGSSFEGQKGKKPAKERKPVRREPPKTPACACHARRLQKVCSFEGPSLPANSNTHTPTPDGESMRCDRNNPSIEPDGRWDTMGLCYISRGPEINKIKRDTRHAFDDLIACKWRKFGNVPVGVGVGVCLCCDLVKKSIGRLLVCRRLFHPFVERIRRMSREQEG